MIKIDFEFETENNGVFRDAIHLQEDHGLTDEQIEELKLQRLNKWLELVNAPPPEIEAPVIEPNSPANEVNILGEIYYLLEGVPPVGAKLIQVGDLWYYKVG